jgi:hypothetical protein
MPRCAATCCMCLSYMCLSYYYDTTMCHELLLVYYMHELLLVYYIGPKARGEVLGYASLRAYQLATWLSSRQVARLVCCEHTAVTGSLHACLTALPACLTAHRLHSLLRALAFTLKFVCVCVCV